MSAHDTFDDAFVFINVGRKYTISSSILRIMSQCTNVALALRSMNDRFDSNIVVGYKVERG